jgi:tetratricopeptide (TPR) repeat protein
MPDKKKSAAVKTTERRMAQTQGSKNVKPAGTPQAVSAARAKDTAAVSSGSRQLSSFEAGMRFFHARKFKEAREQFTEALTGPERDVAQRATLHKAMCDRRLQQNTVSLGSAEEYYNYGIAMINARNMVEARTHLEKALQIEPGADHIHYALALAQALSGDVTNAYDNLRRAIELEPRNRTLARQDADFGPMAHQPPFDALLYPEKKSGW